MYDELDGCLDQGWAWVLDGLEEFGEPGWRPAIEDVLEVVVSMVCMHASDWHRRFLVGVNTMPMLIFRIIISPRSTPCAMRLAAAVLILDSPSSPLVAADPNLPNSQTFFGLNSNQSRTAMGYVPKRCSIMCFTSA